MILKAKKACKYISILVSGVIVSVFAASTVFAATLNFDNMKPKDAQNIIAYYLKNSQYLKQETITSSFFRSLGGFIMGLLAKLANAANKLYTLSFEWLDFSTKSGGAKNLISGVSALILAIFTLSLIILGILIVFGDRKNLTPVRNLFIAICVFAGGATAITTLNSFVITSKNAILQDTNLSPGTTAVFSSIYDVAEYMNSNGLESMSKTSPPKSMSTLYKGLNSESVESFRVNDINNVMFKDNASSDKDADILGHRVTTVPDPSIIDDSDAAESSLSSGARATGGRVNKEKSELVKKYSDGKGHYVGVIDAESDDFIKLMHNATGNGAYYAYYIDWLPMLLELFATTLVLFILAYKTFRLIIEIFVGEILVAIQAPQIHNGKKIRDLLTGIRDTYLTLIFSVLCLKIYFIILSYIKSAPVFAGSGNSLVRSIFIIFAAMTVIDGPNIIEKVTGQDAGLKSGWGLVAGSMMAGRTISHTAKGANRTAGGILGALSGSEKPKTGLGKLAGAVPGAAGKMRASGKESAENYKGVREYNKDGHRGKMGQDPDIDKKKNNNTPSAQHGPRNDPGISNQNNGSIKDGIDNASAQGFNEGRNNAIDEGFRDQNNRVQTGNSANVQPGTGRTSQAMESEKASDAHERNSTMESLDASKEAQSTNYQERKNKNKQKG